MCIASNGSTDTYVTQHTTRTIHLLSSCSPYTKKLFINQKSTHFEEYEYDWKELGESRCFDHEFNAKVESIHANVRGVEEATVLLHGLHALKTRT